MLKLSKSRDGSVTWPRPVRLRRELWGARSAEMPVGGNWSWMETSPVLSGHPAAFVLGEEGSRII